MGAFWYFVRHLFHIDCWVLFGMPLFRLLILNGSPKSPVRKGRGGFWAPQGSKGDPKATSNRVVPRDHFRIECPIVARMPTRCPQDPQGHHFQQNCLGFRDSFAIFVHNCSKIPSGIFDFGPSLLLKFSQLNKSNQGCPRDVWLVPRGFPSPEGQRFRTTCRNKRATTGKCQENGSQMEANIWSFC